MKNSRCLQFLNSLRLNTYSIHIGAQFLQNMTLYSYRYTRVNGNRLSLTQAIKNPRKNEVLPRKTIDGCTYALTMRARGLFRGGSTLILVSIYSMQLNLSKVLNFITPSYSYRRSLRRNNF